MVSNLHFSFSFVQEEAQVSSPQGCPWFLSVSISVSRSLSISLGLGLLALSLGHRRPFFLGATSPRAAGMSLCRDSPAARTGISIPVRIGTPHPNLS